VLVGDLDGETAKALAKEAELIDSRVHLHSLLTL
jgi:hypothetical protein